MDTVSRPSLGRGSRLAAFVGHLFEGLFFVSPDRVSLLLARTELPSCTPNAARWFRFGLAPTLDSGAAPPLTEFVVGGKMTLARGYKVFAFVCLSVCALHGYFTGDWTELGANAGALVIIAIMEARMYYLDRKDRCR